MLLALKGSDEIQVCQRGLRVFIRIMRQLLDARYEFESHEHNRYAQLMSDERGSHLQDVVLAGPIVSFRT